MMRKLVLALALTAACGFGIRAVVAGPGCCKSGAAAKEAKVVKAEGASCSAAKSSCSEFPKLVRMVGDKEIGCSMTAEKVAKESGAKVVFAVAGEKYDNMEKAYVAWADASEDYVKKYTTIACVKDGKLMYCDTECSDDAKTASASCSKAATVVKAEGKSCHAGEAKVASAEGKTCSADKAKMASTEGKTCSSGEAKVVSAGEKKECSAVCTSEDAKKAKSGCCQADKKGPSAEKAKLAKAVEAAKGVCKSGQAAKLAATKDDACCKEAKDMKFIVAGRTFDKYEDAVKTRDAVRAAIQKVSMKYIVDGKEVDCSSKVCPSAKKAGKVAYIVGEQKTPCEYDARVKMAQAQYEAAQKVSQDDQVARS